MSVSFFSQFLQGLFSLQLAVKSDPEPGAVSLRSVSTQPKVLLVSQFWSCSEFCISN